MNTTTKAITPADLKFEVQARGSHFFDRETMRFFGDTMRNYGVRGPVWIRTHSGKWAQAWELYRRRAVRHGLHKSAYFHTETFAQVRGTKIY